MKVVKKTKAYTIYKKASGRFAVKNAENEWIKAIEEAQSTFSIDVDNGSYTNFRRFINQDKLPPPKLLIIATLPFPSLENPLVSSKVNYYKKQYKDWFYSYLLPTALQEMQRSLISLRASKGTITLLDNRINYRSYGKGS